MRLSITKQIIISLTLVLIALLVIKPVYSSADSGFSNNYDKAKSFYNDGILKSSEENWKEAELLFTHAALANPSFEMAIASKALISYQLGNLDEAEAELRQIIRQHPMFADPRAALTALLWHKGLLGEAESHWAAAVGLDSRYLRADWLLQIRRWPPQPSSDLLAFLAFEST